MSAPEILRDPVHGYIELSPIEQFLLERPVVQRLHRITQNGLAYLTYPSNRTSRFIHSLGAMHIVGNMFRAAVHSGLASHDRLADHFVAFRDKLKRETTSRSIGDWDSVELNRQALGGFWGQLGIPDPVIVCAWQAVRLACLLHDLGHLPFSHTCEIVCRALLLKWPSLATKYTVFQTWLTQNHGLREDRALHEMIGVALSVNQLQPAAGELGNQSFNILLTQSMSLARLILLESAESGTALGALHQLFDGEVDADRADYVLRDAAASGISMIGNYDLERITRSMVLNKQNRNFRFVASSKALHALEGFCLARFRVWRALVFHNNVVRSELALSRLLYMIGRITNDDDKDIGSIPLEIIRTSKISRLWDFLSGNHANPLLSEEFLRVDETLVGTGFRELLTSLAQYSGEDNLWLKEIIVYLRFVLDRDKRRLRPLWKRVDEYRLFARDYVTALRKEKCNRLGKGESDPVRLLNLHLRDCLGDASRKREDPIGATRNVERKLNAKLGLTDTQIRLALHMDFDPSLGDYSVQTGADARQRLRRVSEMSTLVDYANKAWESDVQFHAFELALSGNVANPSGTRLGRNSVVSRRRLASVLACCVSTYG